MRFRRLFIGAAALACLCPGLLQALVITRSSSPVLYIDNGADALLATYASFSIYNDGAAQSDIWATIASFSAELGLAPEESGLYHVGSMAAGVTRTAYFYLAATETALAQSATVSVYGGVPPSNPLASAAFSWTAVQDTIAANSNKVSVVWSGPNPPSLGGIITMTVSGTTGSIGSAQILAFTPASFIDWPADTYLLVSNTVTLGAPNAGSFSNRLIIPTPLTATSDTPYVAQFFFRAMAPSSVTTVVSPILYASSGSPVKHTDTGNFGSANFQPFFTLTNALTISKSASVSSAVWPATAVYTLQLANSGTVDAILDQFKDTLPATPSQPTYVPGSSTFGGLPFPDPVQTGTTLLWSSTFYVASATAKDLVYQVTYPQVPGNYVNTAIALVGSTQVDTTVDLTDNSPTAFSLSLLLPTPTNSPTLTGTSSFTHTPTRSPTPSGTQTSTPTWSPTWTPTATPTWTPTHSPTATKSVTETDTPTWTRTGTPTWTPTMTPTWTPSATPTWTPTYSPTATRSRTESHTPTWTPTSTPTWTSTATPTWTLTATPTWTSTYSPTATQSQTESHTPTWTATATPTWTPTATPTWTPTATPTLTPTHSPTATESRTESHTPTWTSTATPSWTPTATPTWTGTSTPTRTPSYSPTATQSQTETDTPTWTLTWTPTSSPTLTPSYTLSSTPSATGTHTPTWTVTPPATPSSTPTFSHTLTATPSAQSFTHTPTHTPSSTAPPTSTNTPLPTATCFVPAQTPVSALSLKILMANNTLPSPPNYDGGGQISAIIYPYSGGSTVAPNYRVQDHLGRTSDGGQAYELDQDAGTKIAVRYLAAGTNYQIGNGAPAAGLGQSTGYGANPAAPANQNFQAGASSYTNLQIAPDGLQENVIVTSMTTLAGIPYPVNVTQKIIVRGNGSWFATMYYISNPHPTQSYTNIRFFQGADWNFNGDCCGVPDSCFYDAPFDMTYGYKSAPGANLFSAGGFRSPFASTTRSVTQYSTMWSQIRTNTLTVAANPYNGDAGTAESWDFPSLPSGGGKIAMPVIWAYANTLNGATLNTNLRNEITYGLNKLNDTGVHNLFSPAQNSVYPSSPMNVTVSGEVALYGLRDWDALPIRVSITSSVSGWVKDLSFTAVNLNIPSNETASFLYPFDITGLAPAVYTLHFYTDLFRDKGLVDQNPCNDAKDLQIVISSFTLDPDQSAVVGPGSAWSYPLTLNNLGPAAGYDILSPSSSQGWPSELYDGPTLVAADSDGNGVWDFISPAYLGVNGLPFFSLGPNSAKALQFVKTAPLGAPQATTDLAVLTARHQSTLATESATLTTTTQPPYNVGKTLYLRQELGGNLNTQPWMAAPGSFTQVPPSSQLSWTQRPDWAAPFTSILKIRATAYYSSGNVALPGAQFSLALFNGVTFTPLASASMNLPASADFSPAPVTVDFPLASPLVWAAGTHLVLDIRAPSASYLRVYHSSTQRSRLDFQTPSFVNVDWIAFIDGLGQTRASYSPGETLLVRAQVSDPFGAYDIPGATLMLEDSAAALALGTTPMNLVATDASGLPAWKRFEFSYALPAGAAQGPWTATVTGLESNGVTHTAQASFNVPQDTPTVTPTATRTATPTASPSRTFSPSPSHSPSPTDTPALSPTPTETEVPFGSTLTATPTPPPTETATPSATETGSPSPSSTQSPSSTATLSFTPSRTRTVTRTLTASPTPAWDACENDDTPAQACVITVGDVVGQVHTSHCNGGGVCDTDWLAFNALMGATYTIETFNQAGGSDTFIELYNPSATLLLLSDDNNGSGGAPNDRILNWPAPATGTYYIRILQNNCLVRCGTNVSYQIRVLTSLPTSPTSTRTRTPTHTPTPSRTASPSLTLTRTLTSSLTSSPSLTASPTLSSSPTTTEIPAGVTLTFSETSTPSASPTATTTDIPAGVTLTFSETATPTLSPTPSLTLTQTPTRTRTRTATPSPTRTPACMAIPIGIGTPVIGNTGGAPNTYNPTCGGTSGPDHLYTFDLPSAATVQVSTCLPGTLFNTKLQLMTSCAPVVNLACNDNDGACGNPSSSIITQALAAGTYYVVVDGSNGVSGQYELLISILSIASPTRTRTPTRTLTPSRTSTPSATHSPTPTPSWTHTPTTTPTFTPSLSATVTDIPAGVTLTHSETFTPTVTLTATVTEIPAGVTLTHSETFTPTASPTATSSPTASRTASPTATRTFTPSCPATPIAIGTPAFGNTVGAPNSFSPGCGSGGPDHLYVFNMPTAGVLQVSTCLAGTSFDTVVALSSSCAPFSTIACNDDAGGACGTQSVLTQALAAGTYYVVVDGWGASQGNYQLLLTLVTAFSPTVSATLSSTPSLTHSPTVSATLSSTPTATHSPSVLPSASATPTQTPTLTEIPAGVTLTFSASSTPTATESPSGSLTPTPSSPCPAAAGIPGRTLWLNAGMGVSAVNESGAWRVGQWNDLSGQGHHALVSGAARPELRVEPSSGALGVYFDGLDDAMDILAGAGQLISNAVDFTVVAHVKYEAGGYYRQEFLSNWNLAFTGAYFGRESNQHRMTDCAANVGSIDFNARPYSYVSRPGGFEVYNGGVLTASGGPLGCGLNLANPWVLGTQGTYVLQNEHLRGWIFDVQVFSRALSAGELATLWSCPPPPLATATPSPSQTPTVSPSFTPPPAGSTATASPTLNTTPASPCPAVASMPGLSLWLRADQGVSASLQGGAMRVDSWADFSGRAHHAGGAGAARPEWRVEPGSGAMGVYFDGVDDVLDLAAGSGLLIPTVNDFTVVARFVPEAGGPANQEILSNWNYVGFGPFDGIYFGRGGGSYRMTDCYPSLGSFSAAAGLYTFISRPGGVQIFEGAALDSSAAALGCSLNVFHPWRVGHQGSFSGNEHLRGYLLELQVYDRALSPAELSAAWSCPAPQPSATPSPSPSGTATPTAIPAGVTLTFSLTPTASPSPSSSPSAAASPSPSASATPSCSACALYCEDWQDEAVGPPPATWFMAGPGSSAILQDPVFNSQALSLQPQAGLWRGAIYMGAETAGIPDYDFRARVHGGNRGVLSARSSGIVGGGCSNCYVFQVLPNLPGEVRILRSFGGSITTLGTAGSSGLNAQDFQMRLVVSTEGATARVRGFIDGVEYLNVVDPAPLAPGGNIGVYAFDTATSYDELVVNPFACGSPTSTSSPSLTATPSATATGTVSTTPTFTATPTDIPAGVTLTFSLTATRTHTPPPPGSSLTHTPSGTPSSTATPTDIPAGVTLTFSLTPTPSLTVTQSSTFTATPTDVPAGVTLTFSLTATRTHTPPPPGSSLTHTPSGTPTFTATPTDIPAGVTLTFSLTATPSASPSPSVTATATPTDIPAGVTLTFSLTATRTNTPPPPGSSLTHTPSGTPSSTATPTDIPAGVTLTFSLTATPSATQTPSLTLTATPTDIPAGVTLTFSRTATRTITPPPPGSSLTHTPSGTPTFTATPTEIPAGVTLTFSLTATPSATETPSLTLTATPTDIPAGVTLTFSLTATRTNTPPPPGSSLTQTPPGTPTFTATPTDIPAGVTLTFSLTATPSASPSSSMTATATPTDIPAGVTLTFSPTATRTHTPPPPGSSLTHTPSGTPTFTATPTDIPAGVTLTFSLTATPTASPSPSVTATSTPTDIPAGTTLTFSLTATRTATPPPPGSSLTVTPTATPTDIPAGVTLTFSLTPTPTATPTDMPAGVTLTFSATATESASPTPSGTESATPTGTPTDIPAGVTLTFSETPTPSASPSDSPSLTATPTDIPAGLTLTFSLTATRTNTPPPPGSSLTHTPEPSFTGTWTPTFTATPTEIPAGVTLTFSLTATPSASPSSSVTATGTPTDIPAGVTLTFSLTATPTPTPPPPGSSLTNTPEPSFTSTLTPSFTATPTDIPAGVTLTFSETATASASPSSSATATATPTDVPAGVTLTFSLTATPTHTPPPPGSSLTNTPEPSFTGTWTPTFTATPTDIPAGVTLTFSLTATPSASPSPSVTATATPTDIPAGVTLTFSPTATPTPTPPPPGSSLTNTPEPSFTPTLTPTFTATPTDIPAGVTLTFSETATPSASPSSSATATATPTEIPAGVTLTFSLTATTTHTPPPPGSSLTASPTGTPTFTATPTDIPAGVTLTFSLTPTPTEVPTASLSALLLLSTTQAMLGSVFTVMMTVENTGAEAASNVDPGILYSFGTGGVALASLPASPIPSLNPGASGYFTWTYTAAGSGSLVFSSQAQGTDANSLAPVFSNWAVSSVLLIVVPTETPSPSSTPTNIPAGVTLTFSLTPTPTHTPPPPGSSLTNTPEPSFTGTLTPTFTATPTDIPAGVTLTFSGTATPSASPSPSVTATATPTDIPAGTTLTFSLTATPTHTPPPPGSSLTNTPEPSFTATLTPSFTATPTDIPAGVTLTFSETATPSASPSPSATPTATPTDIPPGTTLTFSLTATRTATPPPPGSSLTATPTATQTNIPPGQTLTFTLTFTHSETPSSTATPTDIPAGVTLTFSVTATPSATQTPSQTATPSVTATGTPTPTATATPTDLPAGVTLTFSLTSTVTPTETPTDDPFILGNTRTATPTRTRTRSPSPTATPTPSPTPSPTVSATFTVSPTAGPSPVVYKIFLYVYNTAGVLVAYQDWAVPNYAGGGMAFSENPFYADGAKQLTVTLGGVKWVWDGKDHAGVLVATGGYLFKAVFEHPDGTKDETIGTLPVLNSPGKLFAPKNGPAPNLAKDFTILRARTTKGVEVKMKVWNLGGELVMSWSLFPGGNMDVKWDLRTPGGHRLSDGVYVVGLEAKDPVNGSVERENYKLVIMRKQ